MQRVVLPRGGWVYAHTVHGRYARGSLLVVVVVIAVEFTGKNKEKKKTKTGGVESSDQVGGE